MQVLLSIKPEYVRRIFSGEKKSGFGRSIFKDRRVNEVVIYETAPVKRIVGIFSIREVHEETPAAIWKKTSEYAGIDEGRFFEYFSGRDTAYAIEIAEVKKYGSPIDPWEVNERFVPPQSFMYLDDVTYGRHILFSGFVQGPDDDSGYLFSKQTLR